MHKRFDEFLADHPKLLKRKKEWFRLSEDVLQELIASEPQAVVEYPSDDWRAIAYLEVERPYAPRY